MNPPRRSERAAHVSPSRDMVEASLRSRRTGTPEERLDRQLPAAAELLRQGLGGVVAATQAPVTVGRNEGDHVRVWSPNDLDHDLGGPAGKAPEPPLLPGRDDPTHRLVVCDSGARLGECEPPARAFAASHDRPCGRTAAPFAERRAESPQMPLAGLADLWPIPRAAEAALRQQKVEHNPTLGRAGAQL